MIYGWGGENGTLIKSPEASMITVKKMGKINKYKKIMSADPIHSLYICDADRPCRRLVRLYALMGLDRYNFLEGTNYRLVRVKKYTKTTGPPAASIFRITLVARDDDSMPIEFKTEVREESYGKLRLSCFVATPTSTGISFDDTKLASDWWLAYDDCPRLRPWDIFKTNAVNFEVNYWLNDYIRLYLELSVATRHRDKYDDDLFELKIDQVAIEPTICRYDVESETVYIRYHDLVEAEAGIDIDHIAIVRRTYNRHTRCFSLWGVTESFFKGIPYESLFRQNHQRCEIIPNVGKGKGQSRRRFYLRQPLLRRFGVLKMWRFYNPRRGKAFKNRGICSVR